MKYEIVYFDLDNTLLDFSRSEKEALYNTFRDHGIFLTQEQITLYTQINKKWWLAFSQGKYDKEYIVFARFEEFLDNINVKSLDAKRIAQRYLETLSHLAYFLPGAEDLLEKLKKRKQRMAVLTNGVKTVQESRSKLLRLDRFFEFILTSEEVGKPKPDPTLFFKAQEISGVPLSRSVYIGDDPQTDSLAAKNAGVDFILFDYTGTGNDSQKTARTFEQLYSMLLM
ncbi:YjjG family noncanonical pyrimidine nucleotidase [Pseudothermotoga sp. U03pept]|uniref:YjjG family noncanonical pyrimidine nucleotidase n=1 Tax=Pseudothermotoga sp. U03pept TaxID=3447012 RepID=UPI003F11A218